MKEDIVRFYSKEECDKYFKNRKYVTLDELQQINLIQCKINKINNTKK